MGSKKDSQQTIFAHIDSLSPEGKGVARIDGKTVFVNGALANEDVRFRYTHRHRHYDEGIVTEILKPSTRRVTPLCQHFDICGGCSLQHLDNSAQVKIKQQDLLDKLKHLANVIPSTILPPLTAKSWGYRRKARLGVKYVYKKERILVGFREKNSRYLADISECEVLHPDVGKNLKQLAKLIQDLEAYNKIAQIEVAVSDNATALVFRNLIQLTEKDKQSLIAFAKAHKFFIYLQPKGPDTVVPLWPIDASLFYELKNYKLRLDFSPVDFTQINNEINAQMIDLALALLMLEDDDCVLDLFCGIGNFSLPISRKVARLVGVEGEAAQVKRAIDNAKCNNIINAEFHVADLSQDCNNLQWMRQQHYDKLLLDPPRSGALNTLIQLSNISIRRIVYVSCNPATLARDADELVNNQGFRLEKVVVMDMFPHTAHVESIALFVRD